MEQTLGFTFESFIRGILGIAAVVGVCYLFSYNRKKIDWKLVGGGLCMQLVLALAILHIPIIGSIFEWIGSVFIKLMDFTHAGLSFLLGPYAERANGYSFLFHSLPIIIFFSALVSIFYYWGIIQKVVNGLSWVLRKFMNISGAEGLVSAGNIFLGMTESPVLIRKYLPSMNRSEIFLVMVSGMGTIAGSVMGTYIGLLGGNDPVELVLFAKHLLSASIMAVPGSIVISKMLCPQTEGISEKSVSFENEKEHANILGALSSGTSTGIKLVVNIAGMLLVFISLVALCNYVFCDIIGHYTGINSWIQDFTNGKAEGLTFQFMVGFILSPFMWLIGIPMEDIMSVGAIFGQKTILNEFVAYFQFSEWKEAGIFAYEKSIIMSTYLLCGFANISSVGILIGGIGVLAPEKKDLIMKYGFPAMIGGAMVSILSATIIGMIIG